MSSRTDLTGQLNRTIRQLDEEIQSRRARLAEFGVILPQNPDDPCHGSAYLSGRIESRDTPTGVDRVNLVASTPDFDTPNTEYCSLPQCTRKSTCEPKNTTVSVGSVKPIVNPDNYDGSKSFDDWLTNLELCSQINGWSVEQKTRFLAVRLRGPALQVYTDLSDARKHDYSALVKALKGRFSPQGQSYLFRAKLKVRSRRKNEKLPELASDIRRLVVKAYPDISAELREELGKDHFIEALDLPEIRMQVRRAKPVNLGDALTTALEEEAFIQVEYNKVDMLQRIHVGANACQNEPCTSASLETKQPQEDLKVKIQRLEQAVQELQGVLTKQTGRFRKPRGPIVCWNCRQEGHRQYECPYNNNLPQAQPVRTAGDKTNQQGNEGRLSMGPVPSQ